MFRSAFPLAVVLSLFLAVAGVADPGDRATLIRGSSFQIAPNSVVPVPWVGFVEDSAAFWSPANPTRLTAPAGCSSIRLSFGVSIEIGWGFSSSEPLPSVRAYVRQNGAGPAAPAPAFEITASPMPYRTTATGAVTIGIQPGWYFELVIEHDGGLVDATIQTRTDLGTWLHATCEGPAPLAADLRIPVGPDPE